MDHSLFNFTPGGIAFAFGLTLLAGLATGVGSAIAFFARRVNLRFMALSLGFSAGVMLYVSFVEILPKATVSLERHFSSTAAGWLANLGFFGGILVMAVIDALVPKAENPHELRADADLRLLKTTEQPASEPGVDRHGLWRTGWFTALAIAIHNFPEGMATFLAALEDPRAGVAIAVAIALHNIPEGVSVSVPIFYATGRRRLAFALSFLSGVAEPLGGIVAAVALDRLLPVPVIGMVFSSVAGIMIYISIDELLPTARQYGRSHEVLGGIAAGMALMAGSLLLLK